MHGTYIIGASDKAQYKTIQSAVDAMKNGIESAVTFLIEPGTYTEYIVIPEIDGTSENNRVTFRSQTGNSEDVIVRYDNYSPSSSPLGDATQGTFTFNGADYVTLSNLTLTTNNNSYHAVVFVCNQAEHITIDSCYIYRATTTGATNARVVYAYANKETTNNNYFTLSHSTLKGGYIGVALTGNFTNKEIGGRILNNTIEEQGSMGIYLSGGERKAVVDGNVVRNCTTTKTSTKAIDLTLEEGCQISNNHIYTDLSVNADGIYLRAVNGTEAEPVYIYNNVVEHHCDASSSSYAINISRATKNVYLAHNTVQTQGEGVYSLYIKTTQTNLHVQNNLFLSSNNPAVWVPSANYVKDCAIAHNNLYAAQGAFGKIGATEYTDIEAWRTAIKSTSDISEAVQFESEDVLRPVQKGNLVSGEVLAFVTTDISGKARAAVPTLGAYEWIDPTSTSLSTAEQGALLVFPTITADMLRIVGAEGKEVRIVNMQGQVVMRSMLNGTTLDVQALPQGTYLLQAEQHIVRFIKK
ncbi:MAG: T9SS type A sorting domain-containing protein, partial [Paludibacteraceae bacterium]|nr:T9SS type A sorting domain-containing protein [Paludibacteraceae bacterium]